MPAKARINNAEEFSASRARLTPQIALHQRNSASASNLMPSEITLEREVTDPAKAEAFNAAVASPENANKATAQCTFTAYDGTGYEVNVEEGTVVGWRVSQGDENAPVIETIQMLARKCAIKAKEGEQVDLAAD